MSNAPQVQTNDVPPAPRSGRAVRPNALTLPARSPCD